MRPTAKMAYSSDKSAKRFVHRFREMVDDLGACQDLELDGAVRLGSTKVRFPGPPAPIQIQLGGERGKRLHFYPETVLTAEGGSRRSGSFLIDDPDSDGISGFLRLQPGTSLVLGRESPLQRDLLSYPETVAERHLKIKLNRDGLVLKDLSSAHGTCISPLPGDAPSLQHTKRRRARLERLVTLFGGPLEPLPRMEAMELLEAVVEQIESEPRQALDASGRCGGVVGIPTNLTPFFIGDLHARIDNLLVILTRDGFLEGLESGTAAMVILGDAVHPDEDGMEESMDTSMLLMDLIFLLKLAFPGQVFYIRGNHDSFSEDISKNGVPQGILWEEALRAARGAKYLKAMARLYEVLPYVALSPGFIACHAGAPTSKVSRDILINIRDHPKVQREITHVRMRRPNSPSGYHMGDVKRLRRRLELGPKTPFLVGHTPLSPDDTLWLEAGGIPNHHVLFGAHPELVGVIAVVGNRLLAMRYPAEPLTVLYNRLAESLLPGA
jgi:hypothetical protein